MENIKFIFMVAHLELRPADEVLQKNNKAPTFQKDLNFGRDRSQTSNNPAEITDRGRTIRYIGHEFKLGIALSAFVSEYTSDLQEDEMQKKGWSIKNI